MQQVVRFLADGVAQSNSSDPPQPRALTRRTTPRRHGRRPRLMTPVTTKTCTELSPGTSRGRKRREKYKERNNLQPRAVCRDYARRWPRLTSELFQRMTETTIVHKRYKRSEPARVNLRNGAVKRCIDQIASAIALPMSAVFAVPPTSGVRGPSTSIASTASTIACAASG